MRIWASLLCVSAVAAAYVPGKAFDRFITIWLENQVRLAISILDVADTANMQVGLRGSR